VRQKTCVDAIQPLSSELSGSVLLRRRKLDEFVLTTKPPHQPRATEPVRQGDVVAEQWRGGIRARDA
jgi:hypothetical protein